jgi:hypothetical protein
MKRVVVFGLMALLFFGERSLSYANEAGDRLNAFPEAERTYFLGLTVRSAEYACEPVSSLKKGDYRGSAFYLVTCASGRRYLVKVWDDSGGSTTILDCELMQKIGVDCEPW